MTYWDRPVLKERAKSVMGRNYWLSLAVAAIVATVIGMTGGGDFGVKWEVDLWSLRDLGITWLPWNWTNPAEWAQTLRDFLLSWTFAVYSFSIVLVGLVCRVLAQIFLGNILIIGRSRYFTMNRYGVYRFDDILYGFKDGQYMNNVKGMMYPTIYLTLWGLIPVAGWVLYIIKSLAYFMVPYIIAENPNISPERALEISKKATEGEKGDMFVFYLSFIGWLLLGTLACGIGIYFVLPYLESSKAELYGALRYKAVTTGIAGRDEIGADIEL